MTNIRTLIRSIGRLTWWCSSLDVDNTSSSSYSSSSLNALYLTPFCSLASGLFPLPLFGNCWFGLINEFNRCSSDEVFCPRALRRLRCSGASVASVFIPLKWWSGDAGSLVLAFSASNLTPWPMNKCRTHFRDQFFEYNGEHRMATKWTGQMATHTVIAANTICFADATLERGILPLQIRNSIFG